MFELKSYNDASKLHKAGKIIPGLTTVKTNEFVKGKKGGCVYDVISVGDAYKEGTKLSNVLAGVAFRPTK
jgi:hypothetical protein